MSARYLVRFDDICPTMNRRSWNSVETVLLEAGVKPILSVVPDNRDPKLLIDPPDPEFWQRARIWQALGWTIGLHGLTHEYATADAGLVGINKRSEFAGRPFDDQLKRIREGLAIFAGHGLRADAWVAPAHSFDAATVAALSQCGLRVISDGLFVNPHVDDLGMTWIPQQMWRFRSLPTGVWTVCLHHNRWTETDVTRFRRDLRNYRTRFTDVPAELRRCRDRRSLLDAAAARLLRGTLLAGRMLHGIG